MTSQPEVPGADAVYLFREEITQDNESVNSGAMDGVDTVGDRNFRSVYVRLKILTEAGKGYAEPRIYYEPDYFYIGSVTGRTIHSDGTIIPFVGKPFVKEVERSGNSAVSATVFAMPDAQVGSILEYRYILKFKGRRVLPPEWRVQQELFVRAAHYYFKPSGLTIVTGHDNLSSGVASASQLPPGVAIKSIFSQGAYELTVNNIAPIPREEWTPPQQSLAYRVLFYYTPVHSADEYWSSEGRYWSKDVDRFTSSAKLKDAVAQIVAPGDTDKQKVNKIYDAVMALENTSFTRAHTEAENKALGIKIKTADDIWSQKRGNDDEITLLFIAMVRAAGIPAYAMAVTRRDHALFWVNYLSMRQLDDDVAIVTIDGKEQFFDPGQRYCKFGQLEWAHTMSGGLRQTASGTVVAQTPGFGYEDAETIRAAQLQLSADGKLSGIIKVRMSGAPALYWRQQGLRADEDAVNHEFAETLQRSLPPGVEVKVNHFTGLADWKTDLLVQLDVTGGMGTASSKRVFLPSSFFEASEKVLFAHDKREDTVDLHYPSLVQDTVVLRLPKEASIESLPKDARVELTKNARYLVKYENKANTYSSMRMFILANPFYEVKDYPDLKEFYQKVNAQDQQQTILTTAAAPAAGQ